MGMASEISTEAEQARTAHRRAVTNAADYSRKADNDALARREDLYRTIEAAHGLPEEGKLTHGELAEASRWGKGWVRLMIANYRKRLMKAGQ